MCPPRPRQAPLLAEGEGERVCFGDAPRCSVICFCGWAHRDVARSTLAHTRRLSKHLGHHNAFDEVVWYRNAGQLCAIKWFGRNAGQLQNITSCSSVAWEAGVGGKPKGPYFNLEAINAIHMQMQLLAKALPSIFVRVAYDSISVRADTPAYHRTTELWVSEGSSWHC